MSDNFNPSGTQTPAANPYSAPKSDLTGPGAPDQAELAGRGRRLGGAIIDGIIQSVVLFGVLLPFMGGWAGYMSMVAERPYVTGLIVAIVSFVAYIVVNGYFLAKDGQTIAKKILGMKIVRTDGSQADFMRIATRRALPIYACNLIPVAGGFLPLIDALLIFRSSKKCFHDDIADTVVIRI